MLKRNGRRLGRGLGFIILGLVFAAAFILLYRELRHVDVHDILRRMRSTPTSALVAAFVLTVLSYLTLTTYDYLGLRYAGKPLPYSKTAFASFIAYVFSNNIGLSIFSGLAFRYRIYSTFDLSPVDVTKVSLFCGATFWLGLIALGGLLFTFVDPPVLGASYIEPWMYHLLGVGCLLATAVYLALCARPGGQLRLARWVFPLPPLRLAWPQLGAAVLDWVLSSSILYVLLPPELAGAWLPFLSLFILTAITAAFAHVPAGLGILETMMLAAFAKAHMADSVLGALLVYRVLYYLLPLVVAALWMGAFEVANATGILRSATQNARRWFGAIIPRVFSVLIFAAGLILLFSGALPAIAARRAWLETHFPLYFIEASHLFGSITGAALLVVARGLQKRFDGAYMLTIGLLAAGVVCSLAKGVDYEEALILAGALLLLLPCRAYFYRKASLLEARFSPGWALAIALSIFSMFWLGWFGNKHIEYRESLWWTFTFTGDAPRTLRAAFAALTSTMIVGFIYLLRPARSPAPVSPLAPEILGLVRQSDRTYAYLALLRDKHMLLNAAKDAFIMYAIEGRSWVAMGDPVGGLEQRRELIWEYRDLVDRYGGWSAFYQVDMDNLHLYVECGLSLVKLGEEAIVKLADFGLTGRKFKAMRNVMNRLSAEGWSCDIVQETDVEALLPQIGAVSDAWLLSRNVREKRFSIGFFSADYLRLLPVAVLRKDGVIVAFANLWQGRPGSELSVDLMRYGPDAPPGSMDFLLVSLMHWGQTHGYQYFNLGMAPFSGMENRPLAPLWSRLGAKLFERGERLYNFQGLREYKEKFSPEWRPKYLACPPGRALPYVLANTATLISGGLKGAITR